MTDSIASSQSRIPASNPRKTKGEDVNTTSLMRSWLPALGICFLTTAVACESEVDFFSDKAPEDDSSGGNTATDDDDGTGGSSSNGTGGNSGQGGAGGDVGTGGSPDGTGGQGGVQDMCAPDFAPCSSPVECCSGNCRIEPNGGICMPQDMCLGPGEACALGSQCCSMQCVGNGGFNVCL